MNQNWCAANITMYKKKDSLSEISQPTAIKYSFLSKDLEQIHTPVICRDFMHDIVRGFLKKIPISIYGLKYDSSINPEVNIDRTVMLLEFPKGVTPNMLGIKTVIRCLETALSMPNKEKLTDVRSVAPLNIGSSTKFLLISSPAGWMKSPALLSLYTLFIKLAQHIDNKDLKFDREGNSDTTYPYLRDKVLIPLIVKEHERVFTEKHAKPLLEISYLNGILPKLDVFKDHYKKIIDFNEHGFDNRYYNKESTSCFHDHGIIEALEGKSDTGKTVSKFLLKKEDSNKKIKITEYDVSNGQVLFPLGTCSLLRNKPSIVMVTKNDNNLRKIITVPTYTKHGLLPKVHNNINAMDNKFRFLYSIDTCHLYHSAAKKILMSKKIINVIEKEAGVKGSTVMSSAEVKCREYGALANFLFTSNPSWARSLYLLSFMSTLLYTIPLTYVAEEDMKKPLSNISNVKTFLDSVAKKIVNTPMSYESNHALACETLRDNIEYVAHNFNNIVDASTSEYNQHIVNQDRLTTVINKCRPTK